MFITEGWFDAVLLNGVAIFGSKMTSQQIVEAQRLTQKAIELWPEKKEKFLK